MSWRRGPDVADARTMAGAHWITLSNYRRVLLDEERRILRGLPDTYSRVHVQDVPALGRRLHETEEAQEQCEMSVRRRGARTFRTVDDGVRALLEANPALSDFLEQECPPQLRPIPDVDSPGRRGPKPLPRWSTPRHPAEGAARTSLSPCARYGQQQYLFPFFAVQHFSSVAQLSHGSFSQSFVHAPCDAAHTLAQTHQMPELHTGGALISTSMLFVPKMTCHPQLPGVESTPVNHFAVRSPVGLARRLFVKTTGPGYASQRAISTVSIASKAHGRGEPTTSSSTIRVELASVVSSVVRIVQVSQRPFPSHPSPVMVPTMTSFTLTFLVGPSMLFTSGSTSQLLQSSLTMLHCPPNHCRTGCITDVLESGSRPGQNEIC